MDLSPLLVAWGIAAAVMFVLWLVELRTADASSVDVGWAALLACFAVGFAVSGSGSSEQRLLAGLVGGVWGGRLALYLLFDRVLSGKGEDGRYKALRGHWGEKAHAQFAWFYQVQAVLAAGLALPFLLIASNPSPEILPVQWAGVGLFVLAKGGESLADRQLARFRNDPANRGKTCREGLWAWSRHPNYFFEWLIWCAFALLAWPAPYGWLGVVPAAVIYLLINFVSGIPFTEQQSLRSRGDDFRRYQHETSPFFPWPPRRSPSGGPERRTSRHHAA
jgi:steroid 5-alpha reductase family enzyme